MYEYHPVSANKFAFLTDHGITYIVEFDAAAPYFHPNCVLCYNIEAVNFYPIKPPNKKSADPKIALTIVSIIKLRCSLLGGAVVYVCDSLDNKATCRSKLFNKWNAWLNNGEYHFQMAIINYQGLLEVHAGIVVATSNPDAEEYLKEFTSAAYYIASK